MPNLDIKDIINTLTYAENRSRQFDRIKDAYNQYYYRCADEHWDTAKIAPLKDDLIEKIRDLLR